MHDPGPSVMAGRSSQHIKIPVSGSDSDNTTKEQYYTNCFDEKDNKRHVAEKQCSFFMCGSVQAVFLYLASVSLSLSIYIYIYIYTHIYIYIWL
jgi:hypothetical protein